jgi:uncharacterized protein (TIGR00661 family)
MGRILYGVMGDAGGHISRSLAIAHKLRDHEIVFVGGGRVADLAQSGYEVVSVPMYDTKLSGHRVNTLATILSGMRVARERPAVIDRLTMLIRDYEPDLIVSDFEHFLPFAARRAGRACISVDRQHALTHCEYKAPPGHRLGRAMTLSAIRGMHSEASHFLVCSFVPMRPIDPNLTEVFPPVLRDEVRAMTRGEGEHVLVYMRGVPREWITNLLSNRRRRFIVYGYDTNEEHGNLSFRPRSTDGFLRDLANCAYVMSNGGHNLISEALHFGKPLFCLPVSLFYEQLVNAHLMSEAGYGVYCDHHTRAARTLDDFESRLPEYSERVTRWPAWNGRSVAERLRALMVTRGET